MPPEVADAYTRLVQALMQCDIRQAAIALIRLERLVGKPCAGKLYAIAVETWLFASTIGDIEALDETG